MGASKSFHKFEIIPHNGHEPGVMITIVGDFSETFKKYLRPQILTVLVPGEDADLARITVEVFAETTSGKTNGKVTWIETVVWGKTEDAHDPYGFN